MITKPTVFILGAGASAPYGFPLGKGLEDMIVSDLPPAELRAGKPHYAQAFRVIDEAAGGGAEIPQLEAFRDELVRARERSIDAFLQHHPEFMNQGKRAIAWVLLRAENGNQPLRPIDGDGKPNPDKDWYPLLRDLLSAPFDKFQQNKASILTFNYDRSLEQFLFTSLSSRQRDKAGPEAWAAKLHESLPIVHLHGELGTHPAFAAGAKEESIVGYGQPVTAKTVRTASQHIRNVHDEIDLDTDPAFQQAYKLISNAGIIFFLGFQYDERNIGKLRLDKHMAGSTPVFGTGLDMTKAECSRVQQLSQGRILAENILPMDCLRFLRECPAVQARWERG